MGDYSVYKNLRLRSGYLVISPINSKRKGEDIKPSPLCISSFACAQDIFLLAECSRNIHCDSNSSTYHRVVTDAEEAHHLHVCGN